MVQDGRFLKSKGRFVENSKQTAQPPDSRPKEKSGIHPVLTAPDEEITSYETKTFSFYETVIYVQAFSCQVYNQTFA